MTDLRARLNWVKERVDALKVAHKDNPPLSELAYLVGYLAVILDKHLTTDER